MIIEENLKKKEINFKSSKSFSTPKRTCFFNRWNSRKNRTKRKIIKGPKVRCTTNQALDGFIKSNNLKKSDVIKKN